MMIRARGGQPSTPATSCNAGTPGARGSLPRHRKASCFPGALHPAQPGQPRPSALSTRNGHDHGGALHRFITAIGQAVSGSHARASLKAGLGPCAGEAPARRQMRARRRT
jgi:hypothetical protein